METETRRLTGAAITLLRRGDARAARPLLDRATAGGGPDAPWLLLAQACLLDGDDAGETAALDRVLTADSRNLRGLLMRGDGHYRTGNTRLAASFYGRALGIAPVGVRLDPDVLEALRRAEARVAEQTTQYEAHLRARLAQAGELRPGSAMSEALDIIAGRARPQFQAPTSFFYPGLPQTAFHDRAALPWLDAVEAAADTIRAELAAVEADAFTPYVVADPKLPPGTHSLINDSNWSAVHLVRSGKPEPIAARFPRTLAALAHTPQPRARGRFPNAMFSQLRARTHIPPHSGLYNTRLIVHLPLIAPPGCRLRVGNTTRTFEAGRAWALDDSIEHEAWNDSALPRTILLFDIWHPALTADERAALTTLFEAIEDYGIVAPADG